MKVAISLPDPVFDAAERMARELKVSRSQLYAEALAAFLAERGSTAVTEQLNAVYAAEPSRVEPLLAQAQLRSLQDETW